MSIFKVIMFFAFIIVNSQNCWAQSLLREPSSAYQYGNAEIERSITRLRFNQKNGSGCGSMRWYKGLSSQSQTDIGIMQVEYKVTNNSNKTLSNYRFAAQKDLYKNKNLSEKAQWYPASFLSSRPVKVGMRESRTSQIEWRQPSRFEPLNANRIIEMKEDLLPGESFTFWDYVYLPTGLGFTVTFDGTWKGKRSIWENRECTFSLFNSWHRGKDSTTSGLTLAKEISKQNELKQQQQNILDQELAIIYKKQNTNTLSRNKSLQLISLLQEKGISGCRFSMSVLDKHFGFDDICLHVSFTNVQASELSYVYDRRYSAHFEVSAIKNAGNTLINSNGGKFTFYSQPKVEKHDESVRVLLGEENNGTSKWFIGYDILKSSSAYHPIKDLLD